MQSTEAITMAAIGLALDAASLRQQAAAANIANAQTEGYVPVRVSFEAQLEQARLSLEEQGRLEAGALEGVRPALEPAPMEAGGVAPRVMLDLEVASMSRNAAHYQALLKVLSRYYSMLSSAVSDGKK